MRSLHVIDSLGAGGAEKSLVDLLRRLPDDIEPRVVCFHRRPEGFEEAARAAGIDVTDLAGHGRGARVRHLRSVIGTWRPAIVHTTLFEADVAGRLAAAGGPPVLTSLVNTSYGPARLEDRHVTRGKLRAVQLLDAVTARTLTRHFHAITQAVKDAAVRELRLRPERVTVVPRGRDPAELGSPSPERRRAIRRTLGLDEATPVVLNVGRRESQKGQDVLLTAAATLRERRPDVVWLVAGRDGNASAALADQHQTLDLDSTVRFLGHRGDVADLLAGADVFVLPSRYEGLGGSLLEAMALGVPAVTSDIPALREVLDDGHAGVLVPPGDAAALATAVDDLLGDTDRRAQLGAAGRQRFTEHYTIEQATTGMVALLRRVAERPR